MSLYLTWQFEANIHWIKRDVAKPQKGFVQIDLTKNCIVILILVQCNVHSPQGFWFVMSCVPKTI